ncbi:PP0621 family protein [Thiomicrorhabdus sp. zzn3]|uniref:PP0621 family protein n=1 Tax=Thiomicrorhabdus sp. zzn3 TaxID=3039775 RepID=UPI002436C63C|nr:PP0621 family protein [Thiomicrorhabdus sp. zzn3]MDG6778153.1 PP0621 family protein [Thiomicrorhabdus sp. zzn3]
MRAIVFLLFVILVFLILRFTLNRIIEIRRQNREKNASQTQQASSLNPEEQPMVRCAECGVHLPQSEAYFDGQHTFCSEGHMQAYHRKQQEKHEQDSAEN